MRYESREWMGSNPHPAHVYAHMTWCTNPTCAEEFDYCLSNSQAIAGLKKIELDLR